VDTLSLDMRLLRCARLLSAVWWWLVIRWHILSNDIGVVLEYWLMQSLLLGFG
jgi:hypothetical protein